GGSPFSRDVGENNPPASIRKGNEVIPVAAHGASRHAEPGDYESWNEGRTLWQQRLLNGARFFGLAIECGAFGTLQMKFASVIDRHGHVITKCLQQAELLSWKSIDDRMCCRKHPNHPLSHAQ